VATKPHLPLGNCVRESRAAIPRSPITAPQTHAFASRSPRPCSPFDRSPQGVTNLIHLSALGADPYSISEWARTKAAGEQAVRAIAPGATIVRPADIFGAEDRFLNWIAKMYVTLPRVPLVEGGMARVQPVYVDDVAQAIFKIAMVRACRMRGSAGRCVQGCLSPASCAAPFVMLS
jgi:uncharacterized protein YbjT (DUF2867 family)